MNERTGKFPVNLFCSLMLLNFIPFLYTLVRTNLIANLPSTDGLGIAGHMEWFDLIDETVRAFLIVSLYALLNRCMQDGEKFRERVFQTFLTANAVYLLFAVVTFRYCSSLVSAMVSERIHEVTGYLRLETVGFIIANVVSFVNVLFVVLGKPFYVYAMILLRTMATVVGDLLLIPGLGVNGVAYSNIAVNSICVVLCLFVVCREKCSGLFGRRHLDYLKQHRRVTYLNLLTSGRLNSYLADIDRQAQERLERLIEGMKQAQGITERLKAENALEWGGRMNNIRACAREIVNEEIVYMD